MLKFDHFKINSCGFCEVFLSGSENLTYGDRVLSKMVDDGELFMKATNIEGIFKFGLTDNRGYVWSSRVGVLNKEFDVAVIECYYKSDHGYSYELCAIDLAHLEEIIKDSEFKINYEPKIEFDNEPYYRLERTSNDD